MVGQFKTSLVYMKSKSGSIWCLCGGRLITSHMVKFLSHVLIKATDKNLTRGRGRKLDTFLGACDYTLISEEPLLFYFSKEEF